jgi:hypothetical protein
MSRSRGRRMIMVLGTAAAAVFLASCIAFASSVPIEASATAGVHSGAVVWADVTGSGGQDPLVATSDATLVHLVPCGPGCFTRGEAVPLGSDGGNATLASADFNGDGIADVVAASGAGVTIFFGGRARPGRAAGLVATDSVTVTTAPQTQVVAADLDGDGDGDADLGFTDGAQLFIARGDGHGAFSAPALVACYCTSSNMLLGLTVGDFNGDGASELAVLAAGDGPSGPSGEVDIWPFAPGTTPYHADVGFYYRLIAAGDVNGDGRDDLVFGVNAIPGFTTGGEILVSYSTGAGFTSAGSVTAGGFVGTIVLRDANADGHIDLFATDTTHQRLDWFQGTGGAFFQPKNRVFSHEAGPGPSSLAFGTPAGITKPDLIVSNPTASNARVSYLRNTG